jgi:TRAP-type C4-dicarboxylate transport system substrate-binding protein
MGISLLRKSIVPLLLLTMAASFAFAGETPAKNVKLTWSSISVPADAHTKAMWVFKTELERLSDGRISVELYTSGQIFTQEGELAAVREGTLDMAYYGAA